MSTPTGPTAAPRAAGDRSEPDGARDAADVLETLDAGDAPGAMAAGSGRPLSDQGRERQQQLVDASIALFSERGYAATRIRDICDRAGVAKGLFYWYFPTKLDLFAELVRTMRRRLRRAQAAAMDPDADAITRLRQGTAASVVFMAEHAAYFALVDVERADPTIADTLRAGSQVYLDDVTALLREAQHCGDVVDTDPHVLALGVLGAVSSYSNAWRAGRIDMTPEQLADFVAGWVVRALR